MIRILPTKGVFEKAKKNISGKTIFCELSGHFKMTLYWGGAFEHVLKESAFKNLAPCPARRGKMNIL